MLNIFKSITARATVRVAYAERDTPARTYKCAAALCLAMALAPVSAESADLRLLSSFNSTQKPTYAVLQKYLENVKAIGGDSIRIMESGPETVPIFEQLQPVSMGVFDMLYTNPIFHAGNNGLALAFDTIDPNPIARRNSGAWANIDEFYQSKHNLKLVALMSVSLDGYHLFTTESLTAEGDLRGRKIRGTPTYHGVIRALGAEPVVLPGSEIYSALQRGVVDGAGWPAAGMLDMKHYEVAKYRLRPTFGVATQPVFINLDSWKKLSEAEQKTLLDAGYKTELEMLWIGKTIQADEDRALDKLGTEIVYLSDEKAAQVRAAFNDSIWTLARDCCGEAAEKLRQIALDAGLTN